MLLVLVVVQILLEVVRALLDLLESVENILLTDIDGPLQDFLVRFVVFISCL